MIISTSTYADFKTLADAMTTPAVIANTDAMWRAAAYTATDAVTLTLPTEPGAFATDFPGCTVLTGPFSVE